MVIRIQNVYKSIFLISNFINEIVLTAKNLKILKNVFNFTLIITFEETKNK
jgi:hypothetical protein